MLWGKNRKRIIISGTFRQSSKQDGQGVVEYAILLALIALAGVVSLTSLGSQIKESLQGLTWGTNDEVSDTLVVSVLDNSRTGIGNVRVFAYDDQGTYLETFQPTGAKGNASFELNDGRFQFLAQHQLQWFWSDTVNRPGQNQVTIQTGQAPFTVSVIDINGNIMPDLSVYAFTEEEEYIGVEGITDENGQVVLGLVDNIVKFRVDHEGKPNWSDTISTDAGAITITLSPCGDGQYLAEYFNNTTLSGDPEFTQCESEINNLWKTGGPGNGLDVSNFSVRWTGYQLFEEGTYSLFATADDGVRVWLDGNLLLDGWRNQPATTYRSQQTLSGRHEIKMEYYERYGHATAILGWEEVITSCPTGQFMAEYFNNRNLSGDPTIIRCENSIDNSWGYGGPGNGINVNEFSVRWTGRFQFEDDTYVFGAIVDDGVRIWVDNQLITNAWVQKGTMEYRPRQEMTSGEHEVKMEYYEYYGGATAKLNWERAIVSCPTGQFLAEYYNNINLSGDPALSQCENSINYNWSRNIPANGVNKDNFSVRWTGTFEFSSGEAEFEITTDDGMQLFVDNSLLINSWRPQSATKYTATHALSSGEHEVRVNYYERGGYAVAKVKWD